MKIAVNRLIRGEKGQALIMALVLLVVGGLIITPLLGLMNTGLLTGQVYENKMYELYAADAGIEDALYKIKNVGLADFFDDYDEYDYSTVYPYPYDLDINDKDVHVTIENVWIPKGIPAPDFDTARQIIEAGELIIAGSPSMVASRYEIKISYQGCGDLSVNTIGIWLPPGFEYDDNCSLEGEDYYPELAITPHKGGYAVVWSFSTPVALSEFPDSFTLEYESEGLTPGAAISWIDTTGGYTWDADVKIYKITSTATDPDTETQTTIESYSSKIEPRKLGSSLSGDYVAVGATLMTATGDEKYRNRLSKESSATVAVGDIPSNAVIEAAWLYWSGWIEGAPGAGLVIWGVEDCSDFVAPIMGWTAGSAWDTSTGRFRGTAYNKPTPGKYLTMSSSIDLSPYVGQTVEVSWQQDEGGRLEDEDRLYFAFSADGGSTWSDDIEAFRNDNPESPFAYTIPDAYLTDNFRMRFYLYGFSERSWLSGTEYCYIDDITISASTGSSVEDAKVNRVMFNDNQITTDQWQVEPTPDAGEQSGSTGGENSWSYSCFYDATDLVKQFIADGDIASNGAGTYTLGHWMEGNEYDLYGGGSTDYPLATPAQAGYPTQYQWTYAGWSLLVIYSSPETKGHQLYLFDTFHYVGLDTLVEFSISNFLAPDDTTGSHLTYFVGEGDNHYDNDYIKVNGYKLPRPGDPYEPIPPINPQNNVFNSYSNSLDDPYISGIDIDTFDVSGCIDPGDTSAEVILDNGEEIYDLVYIILSFRSETTSGGIMGYLIR